MLDVGWVATGIFLVQAHREGQSLWRVFWLGGTLAESAAEDAPEDRPTRPDVVSAKAMGWGVALPWNLLVSVALGVWLMASPAIFGTGGGAAHSDHVIGALVVTSATLRKMHQNL